MSDLIDMVLNINASELEPEQISKGAKVIGANSNGTFLTGEVYANLQPYMEYDGIVYIQFPNEQALAFSYDDFEQWYVVQDA